MSRWRAEALKRLPELRQLIESADSIMSLWTEVWPSFQRAYRNEPRNEALIAGIYSFAKWCERAPRNSDAKHDPFTAVVVAFYEDLPSFRPARDDMPRWFTYSEVEGNRTVFSHQIGDEGYAELLGYMMELRHNYRPQTG